MKRIATICSLLVVVFLFLSCSMAIAIDTTPPLTTANPPGGGYIYGGMLSLSCSDGSGSGCKTTYYCFSYGGDCTPTKVYASPIYIEDGTLNYYSIDNAGNSEAVKSDYYQGMPAFNDFDPPVTTANPASGSYIIASGSSQIVSLSCDDSGAPYSYSFPSGCMGTYYCLGSGCNPTNVYNGGISLNASQTVRYYSTDAAYNQEFVQEQTYTIIIDTTPPATTVNAAGGIYNSAQNVILACNDGSGTGCKTTYYCLGTGCTPATVYGSPIPIISSQTVRYYSVDKFGNSEAINSQNYVIDTVWPAQLAVTGQTTCYDTDGTAISCPGTGQDGEIRVGVAWPVPRFTDNGNGTVTDILTGLIWLKNANCFGTQVWTSALTSANLLASGQCGLSDGSSVGQWRLPNVNELESLVDEERGDPVLPVGHLFTGVQTEYWSSSSYANDTSYAWRVYMYGGYLYNYSKASYSYVWPVRAGQ